MLTNANKYLNICFFINKLFQVITSVIIFIYVYNLLYIRVLQKNNTSCQKSCKTLKNTAKPNVSNGHSYFYAKLSYIVCYVYYLYVTKILKNPEKTPLNLTSQMDICIFMLIYHILSILHFYTYLEKIIYIHLLHFSAFSSVPFFKKLKFPKVFCEIRFRTFKICPFCENEKKFVKKVVFFCLWSDCVWLIFERSKKTLP
jgi:uncharacterized Zn-finger protein